MKVILHADDFGYDQETVTATIELLDEGTLTSASIMATMPATEQALAYAAVHKDKSFGVHLTYVDGLQPSLPKSQSSLLDTSGLFYQSDDVRKKALLHCLQKKDIVEESLAQIARVENAGVKVSHLDSHGHLHKFPSFLAALPNIMKESGIEKVRRVQNIFIQKPKISITRLLNNAFDWRISHICKTTDYFYMSANSMDVGWSDVILQKMDKLPQNAVIEIGIHPGQAGNPKERWRINEFNDAREFVNKIRASGAHRLISWNDV